MRSLLAALCFWLVAAVTGVAQPPPADFMVSGVQVGSDPGGMWMLSVPPPPVSPVCLFVTGTYCTDIGDLLYDPWSGNIITGGITTLGGTCPGNGQIRRVIMNGNIVSSETLFSTIPSAFPAPVLGLVHDSNGHYICASGQDVWRVNRWTGVCSTVNSSPFFGICTAVAEQSILYAAVDGLVTGATVTIFRVDTDGNAIPVGSTLGIVSGAHFVSGLALGPDQESLWASIMYVSPGAPSLVKFDLSSGIPPFLGQGLTIIAEPLSDIEFRGGATPRILVTGGTFDSVFVVDPLLNPPTVSQVACFPGLTPWGSSSGITLNRAGNELFIFPSNVDVGSATSATFDIALHGTPGNFGVMGITSVNGAPFLLVLGSGVFGIDGRLSLPQLMVGLSSAMANTTLSFGYAEFIPGFGAVIELYEAALFLTAKSQTAKKLNEKPNDHIPKQIVLEVDPGETVKVTNGGPDAVTGEWRMANNTNWTPAFVLSGPSLGGTYSGTWSNSSATTLAYFRVSMADQSPGSTEHTEICYNVD